MDLAAGTKTSTLNQSVSGRFFARCRRHFTSRSFSKRMIPAGERFPLRDFEIPRARVEPRSLSDRPNDSHCAIIKSLGHVGKDHRPRTAAGIGRYLYLRAW